MSGKEMMAGLYAAFGRGDVPTVLGAMDPGIHWHEAEGNPYMPSGEAFVGPDSVLGDLFAKLPEDWDGFTVTPVSYHDAGGVVVVEGRYTGRFKATGTPLDAQFCHVWSLSDGKITKFQQYTDTGAFQRIMGGAVE
jgi:ketosteroid isomerase-like protein